MVRPRDVRVYNKVKQIKISFLKFSDRCKIELFTVKNFKNRYNGFKIYNVSLRSPSNRKWYYEIYFAISHSLYSAENGTDLNKLMEKETIYSDSETSSVSSISLRDFFISVQNETKNMEDTQVPPEAIKDVVIPTEDEIAVNHVVVGFFHIKHPVEILSGEILSKISADLENFLDEVDEAQGRSYIRFVGNTQIFATQGWMKVVCENLFTWNWLSQSAVQRVTTVGIQWVLKVLEDVERVIKVTVKLPNPKQKLVVTVMFKRFKSSNFGLDVSSWKFLGQKKVDGGNSILITLGMNQDSINFIFHRNNGELRYGMQSSVKFRQVGINTAADTPIVQYIGFDD